jgi:hypothetical protein
VGHVNPGRWPGLGELMALRAVSLIVIEICRELTPGNAWQLERGTPPENNRLEIKLVNSVRCLTLELCGGDNKGHSNCCERS